MPRGNLKFDDHGNRQEKQHNVANNVGHSRRNVQTRPVDADAVCDGHVPAHGDWFAREDAGKEDSNRVPADKYNRGPCCYPEPALGRKSEVEDEEGEFGQGTAEDVDKGGKIDVLVSR